MTDPSVPPQQGEENLTSPRIPPISTSSPRPFSPTQSSLSPRPLPPISTSSPRPFSPPLSTSSPRPFSPPISTSSPTRPFSPPNSSPSQRASPPPVKPRSPRPPSVPPRDVSREHAGSAVGGGGGGGGGATMRPLPVPNSQPGRNTPSPPPRDHKGRSRSLGGEQPFVASQNRSRSTGGGGGGGGGGPQSPTPVYSRTPSQERKSPRPMNNFLPPSSPTPTSPNSAPRFEKTDAIIPPLTNTATSPGPAISPRNIPPSSNSTTPRSPRSPRSPGGIFRRDENEEGTTTIPQGFASMMKAALDMTHTRDIENQEKESSNETEPSPRPISRGFGRKSQPKSPTPMSPPPLSGKKIPPASPRKKDQSAGFINWPKKKKRSASVDISSPSSFKKLEGESPTTNGGGDGDLLDALRIAKGHNNTNPSPPISPVGGQKKKGELDGNAMRALMEIVETERNYVLDMVLLVTHYKKPCLSNHLLPDDQAEAAFMNVEQLMHVHTKIVENFGDEPNIDTVISSYEESCPILIREYGNFASQYTYAIDILDNPKLSKEFVLFCETSRQIPANKGLSLGDFLIKPIQRICKYPLLFRELRKNLPDNHPNIGACENVRTGMDLVAGRVNEAKKIAEDQKMRKTMEETIEGLGELSLEKSEFQLSGIFNLKGQKRTLFLLSDIILCCQKNRFEKKYLLKRVIPLKEENLFIEILMATNPVDDEVKSLLKISSQNLGRILLEFSTKKDALDWSHHFQQMQKDYSWIRHYAEKPLTPEEIERDPLHSLQYFSDPEMQDSGEEGEELKAIIETITLKKERERLFGGNKKKEEVPFSNI